MCGDPEVSTEVLEASRKPALYGKSPQRRPLCSKDQGGGCEMSRLLDEAPQEEYLDGGLSGPR